LNYCGFFFLFSGFYFRVKLGEFVCFLRNHEGKQRKVEWFEVMHVISAVVSFRITGDFLKKFVVVYQSLDLSQWKLSASLFWFQCSVHSVSRTLKLNTGRREFEMARTCKSIS
jgi:hypothetical protein